MDLQNCPKNHGFKEVEGFLLVRLFVEITDFAFRSSFFGAGDLFIQGLLPFNLEI